VQAVKLWEFMRDSGQYSAESVQAAWERAQTALIASGDSQASAAAKARDAIKDLDSRIASLRQSIADEAPEKVMGTIEKQTRARIAAMEAERDAATKELEALMATAVDTAKDVAAAIRDIPNEIAVRVRMQFEGSGASSRQSGSREEPEDGFSDGVGAVDVVRSGMSWIVGQVSPNLGGFARGEVFV
jgi:hypothetical protein